MKKIKTFITNIVIAFRILCSRTTDEEKQLLKAEQEQNIPDYDKTLKTRSLADQLRASSLPYHEAYLIWLKENIGEDPISFDQLSWLDKQHYIRKAQSHG